MEKWKNSYDTLCINFNHLEKTTSDNCVLARSITDNLEFNFRAHFGRDPGCAHSRWYTF